MDKRAIQKLTLICVALGLCIVLPALMLSNGGDPSLFSFQTDDLFNYPNSFLLASALSLVLAHAFAFFAAFEKSTPWAMAVLFIPFALIVFLLLHTREAKPALPFFVMSLVLGLVYLVIT